MKVFTIFLLLAIFAKTFADDGHMHPKLQTTTTRRLRSRSGEETSEFWIENAQNALKNKLNQPFINTKAKNVILFLGDGMSIPTLAATRVYLNDDGKEENELSFEKFPYAALSKTYCVDRQVADSACTGTAYLCGIKANYGTMGVNAQVLRDDCSAQNDTSNHITSIARWSKQAGKSAGIVTTARVTHASPGAAYAHIAERDWESDTDILDDNQDPSTCPDIADQLVHGNTKLDVILGGGRAKFLPLDQIDDEGIAGERSDGRNLIEEWINKNSNQCFNPKQATYVWNRDELLNINASNTNYLLGLFNTDHMNYYLDRNENNTEPTLEEMTEKAIELLSRNENGYFLFVEGARIDMAHHETWARKALEETVQFSNAIQKAVDLTNETDTLIVVTSDHSHTLTYSGYPKRGNDILGVAGKDADKLPYATLSYANGLGYKENNPDGSRYDISADDFSDKEYRYPATQPLSSETHGGDDVGVFARGPFAHLFTGVIEENLIPHIMAYASCVGDGEQNPDCSAN